jgi:hypothetical protein
MISLLRRYLTYMDTVRMVAASSAVVGWGEEGENPRSVGADPAVWDALMRRVVGELDDEMRYWIDRGRNREF